MRAWILPTVFFVLTFGQTASAATIGELQRLLNNAGYNVGGETGEWSPETSAALAEFAEQHGIVVADGMIPPDEAATAELVAAATAALDAEYQSYPTQPLPDGYFVGIGDANYFNINAWSERAAVNVDGQLSTVPIERYFQPIDADYPLFRAAGVPVVRAQIGMEGLLFFEECDYRRVADMGVLDECYAAAYSAASAAGWAKQLAMLDAMGSNPIVNLYLDSVERWNREGFHVLVVPTDFFNGVGAHFDGTDEMEGDEYLPLFHRALMRDSVFRELFPKLVGALVEEFKKRGISNISIQSANEPRFCSAAGQSRPRANDVGDWEAVERAELDAIRRVAPRISFVSTAVCTASVTYFDQGERPYSDLASVMPYHPEIDGVTYAFHLYTPRAIFLAGAQNDKFKTGTEIHFPYKRIPGSAAANDGGADAINVYNRVQPGPKFIASIFRGVQEFAAQRGIRVVLTETGIAKPEFGMPRLDRLALLKRMIETSSESGVPFFYFSTVGQWGLSSCPDSFSVPDHRFDPAMLNLIGWANGVAGTDPGAEVEPLEVQCGPPAHYQTSVQFEGGDPMSPGVDAIFETRAEDLDAVLYNVRGFYSGYDKNFVKLEITLINPSLGKSAPEALRHCGGHSIAEFDNADHLSITYRTRGNTITSTSTGCLIEAVPERLRPAVELLTQKLGSVVGDMVKSGQSGSVSNQSLSSWLGHVADGTITISAEN